MPSLDKVDFDRIIADPSSTYRHPEDVLSDARLSREQKIIILKQWAYDAREIEVAQGENMRGGESILHHVLMVLNKIEDNK